ncbi:MAG TPA: acyltransferase [Ktedonobacterales bacterium]
MAVKPVAVGKAEVASPREVKGGLWGWLWPENGAISPIPALDGLRALAVVLVLLFHAWSDIPDGGGLFISADNPNPLNYGRTGVQLFFVLSGFLLFLPYAHWLFGLQGRPSVRLFYKRRALRVGPAYWASLLILALAAGPLTLTTLYDVLLHIFFISNVSASTASTFNTVYWTMAVEVQFYVVLPLLGWLIVWLGRRFGAAVAALSVIVALQLLSIASEGLDQLNQRSHRIPFDTTGLIGTFSLSSWIGVFSAGIACSILYVYLTRVARIAASQRIQRLATAAFVLGAGSALTIACVPALHGLLLKWLLFGWAYAGLLVGILLGAPLLRRPFESVPLRFVGLISYSVYLWHSVMLRVLEIHLPAFGSPALHVIVRFVLGGVLAVAVAYVSYQLVERPFMRARRQAHEAGSAA